MIDREELEKIKKFARSITNRNFSGKAKGNKHLERVAKIVRFLRKKEGGRNDIVIAAAFLHDIGLSKGNEGHEVEGVEIARCLLLKLGIDDEDIAKVSHCILCHEGSFEAGTLEAKLVHDADVLDKSGPLGVIRYTWKLANCGVNSDRISKVLPGHLRKRQERLYTKTAKRISKNLSKKLDEFFETLAKQTETRFLK